MKKFLTIILALVLACSLAVPVLAEEPTNYAEGAKWTKGNAGAVTETDGVAVATGITNKWNAPNIDILPAVKEAIDGDDEIEITIAFEFRATFTKGNEGGSVSARTLMRGANGLPDLKGADNSAAWNEAYEESLDGEDPLFNNSNGNILKYLNYEVDFTEEWTEASVSLFVYGSQVENECVTEWNFTVDNISEPGIVETLEFKNFAVYLADEAPEIEEPEEPEEPEVPAAPQNPENPQAPQNPTVTQAPAQPSAPAGDSLNQGNNNGGDGKLAPIVIYALIASAVIIIGTAVGAVIVVKKKLK